ncbi:acetyl-CoA carboxylase biotin carboxylase subunit [Scopulibacillus daqui]|uniref:biotin carboxylase n=1 Tax=Scopulibacillus daqui TaxID=1469162 RepID=A0ABS2PW23_9BACL|nr:acetyl-CoA carboxylase biotin carboxylase subunit [Scopulibacillus daqui]MBM7644251.1 acetyl-CoA carboxylase biotin carboxylase subunit [Scopulibacillus daqui]
MRKVLIANRGEIADRIIRTCRRLNIETVAVYSEADKELPYIKKADQAVCIGKPPAQKSYMNQEAILKAAKQTGADAIHPGYGFLSENAGFVRAVDSLGLTFIGPDAEVVALMGDKIRARETMKQAGVPIVPGSGGAVDVEGAKAVAETIGYPVMLKASAGGGGIGMQLCRNEEQLIKAFASNQARARTYFGDSKMFVEKAVENGRHIEVQIFGDFFGHIVHLYERDCSVQRRHQKVIEESPSPFISEKTRKAITDAAVKAAKFVNYKNAGTVEFIMDEEENFYFLEMNTRLQVEHPVTEMQTGLDLVEWQLMVADGQKLPLQQSDITYKGHSMEFRLYAEDPETFLPSPGRLTAFAFPDIEGVRIDAGYEAGLSVTPYYDPMIAKIIVSGYDREDVLRKAARLFNECDIKGIKTNYPLFAKLVQSGDFYKGQYTTRLLK